MIIERNNKTWTELELRLLDILQENGMNEMLQPNCVEQIILEFENLPVFKNLSKGAVISSVCKTCKADITDEFIPKCYCHECGNEWQTDL